MRTQAAAIAVPADHQQVGAIACGDNLAFDPPLPCVVHRRPTQPLLRILQQLGGIAAGAAVDAVGSGTVSAEQSGERTVHDLFDIAGINMHENDFRIVGQHRTAAVDGSRPDALDDPDDDPHADLLV